MLLKSQRSRAGIALGLGITLTVLLAPSARAATIQVNSSVDPIDGSNCTLRQAIENAGNNAQTNTSCAAGTGDDTITFASSLLGDTITLSGTELSINPTTTGTLDIQGPGAALLEVSANNASRVIHLTTNAVPTANRVTIHGLTISNGSVTGANGGGILNQGSLVLDNDVVRDSIASVTSNGGTTNQATAVGGGIESSGGALTVSSTTVRGNVAESVAGGGSTSNTATALGGGIHASGDFAGILQIDQSSFYDNVANATATDTGSQAVAEGGGVWSSAGAQTSIARSTIANNTLSTSGASMQETGGGVEIKITAPGAFAASLIEDTVTGNDATTAGANLAQTGNGLQIRNTIVADASGASNCSGVTSLGHNIADDGSCNPIGTGDQNTDPVLLTLGDYGGAGLSRPPDVGSPAIDAGLTIFTTDQRDLTRPWEFINVPDATGGDGADVGSVEVQGPFVSATDPASPSTNRQPRVIGGAEDGSTIELHATGDCSDSPLGTGTTGTFAVPGIMPASPLALDSTTTFHAQSLYGTARSACSSTSVSYTVPAGLAPPATTPPVTTPPSKKKCKKGKKKKRAVSAKKKCKKRKRRLAS
jgi:hypothetical protein